MISFEKRFRVELSLLYIMCYSTVKGLMKLIQIGFHIYTFRLISKVSNFTGSNSTYLKLNFLKII